jgi:adenylate kinase family enzyme
LQFSNLDVNALIRDENERKTAIGLEFLSCVSAGKIIPAEMIVRMLRKIIYSGDRNKKYLLNSFPDIIDQAKEFEKNCATITAIIYAER